MERLSSEQVAELRTRVNDRIAEWELPSNLSVGMALPAGIVRLVCDVFDQWAEEQDAEVIEEYANARRAAYEKGYVEGVAAARGDSVPLWAGDASMRVAQPEPDAVTIDVDLARMAEEFRVTANELGIPAQVAVQGNAVRITIPSADTPTDSTYTPLAADPAATPEYDQNWLATHADGRTEEVTGDGAAEEERQVRLATVPEDVDEDDPAWGLVVMRVDSDAFEKELAAASVETKRLALGLLLYGQEEKRGIIEASLVAEPERACRVCGCTDDRACEGGCWWVEPDLCSACAPKPEPLHAPNDPDLADDWPDMPDLEGGIDRFAEHPVAGEPTDGDAHQVAVNINNGRPFLEAAPKPIGPTRPDAELERVRDYGKPALPEPDKARERLADALASASSGALVQVINKPRTLEDADKDYEMEQIVEALKGMAEGDAMPTVLKWNQNRPEWLPAWAYLKQRHGLNSWSELAERAGLELSTWQANRTIAGLKANRKTE